MINLKNLSKYYSVRDSKLEVLKSLNLEINAGELIAITGKSGSGKTTLLNILGILDEYEEGEYFFEGRLIKNLTDKEGAIFRNKNIGFVFQSFHLITHKTALENVDLALFYQSVKRKEREELSKNILEKVGLANRMNHLPSELSGGEKQRVAIARALVTTPKLIIADEPTGALDSKTSQEILELLKSFHKEGQTVIIVTHDKEVAVQCERVIHLDDGRIV